MFINKLVTVAIPAYKASFLKEAIESVLNQTYINWELIIVNDNSPYNLDEIVQSFNDSRIRYYKNKANLGKNSIAHNWNKCLSYAKGEFFILLCDDDIMKPGFISTMIQYARLYPFCSVFKTRCFIIDKDINHIIKQTPEWDEYQNEHQFITNKFRGLRKHTISEFFYRTEHIKNLKYTPYPAGYYSDDVSILQFIKGSGIVSTSETLMIFRCSNEHISGSPNYNIQKVKAAIIYYKWIFSTYKNEIEPYIKTMNDKMDYEFYSFFIKTNSLLKAIYILFIIPSYIWNFRKKCICLKTWLIKKIGLAQESNYAL